MNTYDVSSKSLNELISLKGKTVVVFVDGGEVTY